MQQKYQLRELAMRLVDESHIRINSKMNEQKYADAGLITHTLSPLTLSHGYPSLCILFSELSIRDENNEWLEYSNTYIKKIVDLISNHGITRASLFSGTAGIAIAIKIASMEGKYYNNLLKSLNKHLYSQIDQILEELNQKEDLEMFDYDVMEGLTGISNYLLMLKDDEDSKNYLKKIMNFFVYLAERKNYGEFIVPNWHIKNRNLFTEKEKLVYKNGILNLGLSHGITGPLIILSKAYKKDILVNNHEQAMKNIIRDLLSLKNHNDNNWGGMIPIEKYHNKQGVIDEPTRSTWCYGTPGVAFSLLCAAEALNDKELIMLAKQSMLDLIGNEKTIYSPTFCHGYAGIAYIYKRFYEKTSEDRFLHEAIRLKSKVMEFYDNTTPFGFYDIEKLDDDVLHLNSIGILQGVAGILLCLLSFESNTSSSWDAVFLLND
ncbi:hypothetical protein COD13_28670 [Priestia megaterium]|uniref:lanthionine synthetase C family protein n=1 Tax=Priestia megaterium TaxID=1404 RepID=UPI000BF79412|nr:lanthionine synthetase C family protein [Priestia megaterium]PFP33148.1 hypothetical protein COK03_26600 [Priestia megaterium]PGR78238.1 hypothetical protein COC53_27970 [Priestia megaterium]PGT49931.1 hypothetical protein COD13_28670 [Priestia megaterium]